ncbi:MAG: bacteriocin transport accessory protein [Ruminococcus sp.]|nr:bacteriocin transport accessory protein [Ruminococcus sp.]MBQ6835989.1 bacteriocin transport accessory protein [Clostridia bacterium]
MKRIIAVIMAAMLMLSLAACGGEKAPQVEALKPLDVLNTVWASYEDAEKFPAGGGDMLSEETTSWEGPAAFGVTGDAVEALNATLHFPTESASKITEAASLMHAMNANTFTCGVFKVADANEMDALVTEIKATIDGTQWMCGFPEKVLIAKTGDTIVSVVGNTDLVDTFNTKLTTAYTSTVVVIDEAIVA